MSITVAATFTKSSGQPATGLTLAEINLYLTAVNRSTGVSTVIWNGSQHPTAEVSNAGGYIRIYTGEDWNTYDYFAAAQYAGADVLDSNWVVGSYGVSDRAAGAGAIVFTYTLTSAVDGLPIADADVWATTDLAGVNVVASGTTNSNGQVVFYLDAGTIYIWRQKDGWDFVNPDTETVV
jgi:hypothetical protein